MTRVGLVTIGQSPREDIAAAMFAGCPPAGVLQAGALDLLDKDAIGRLAPAPGETPLVTRLRDGCEVVISKPRILGQLQQALDRVVAAGADIVVVLCTGSFPELTSPVPVVFPDRVLRGTVDAIVPTGTLGVMMPHAGQQELMERKWVAAGRQIVCAVASPYTASATLAARARELGQRGATLIVMDCMGYDRDMKRAVAAASGRPTLLANRLVGRVVEEISSN